MTAFLSGHCPPFRTATLQFSKVCPRRNPVRSPPRVRFSAITDEAPPLNGPPTRLPPPRRPEPNTPPKRPAAFTPPPAETRDGLKRPNRIPEKRSEPEGERGADDNKAHRGRREYAEGGGKDEGRTQDAVEADVVYYTICAGCRAAYPIKPQTLGPRGRKVGCSVCGNEWFQKADRLMVLKDTEAMKAYPVEEKENLIEEQMRSRRRPRREDGDRREKWEPREGGLRESGRRESSQRESGRRESGRMDRPSRVRQGDHSLFIGNLPFSITQEALEEFVGQVVSINRVSVVTDSNFRSKGFAFADLKSAEDVQKAVSALDGKSLGGRTISVKVGRKN